MIAKQAAKSVREFMDRSYGPKTFANFASGKLGHKFEEKEFVHCEFKQAATMAKEEAMRHAQSAIIDAMEEHLNEDADQREWNWESLVSWFTAKYGVKLKTYDL